MALKTFTLNINMHGSQTMPDGKTLNVWGFVDANCCSGGGVIVPNPLITVNEGDDLEITVNNHSMMEHTLHLHGLDVDTANDSDAPTDGNVRSTGCQSSQRRKPGLDRRPGLYQGIPLGFE